MVVENIPLRMELDTGAAVSVDEMLSALAGGKLFSKIDLSRAYLQVLMSAASRKYLTVNTHKGLFEVNRLPFGVASAPALFQRIMDTMLKGLDGVVCYLDDILVTGRTEAEHMENLESVLKCLSSRGVRVKKEKCEFLKSELQFLGHVIGMNGISTAPEKVQAILEAPAPSDRKQLRSFLGMITYYAKFLSKLSSIAYPLNRLLSEKVKWTWSSESQRAFEALKKAMASAPVLQHYDPSLPLQVSADASPYGVGAVLAHVDSDGTGKPIAYASRTLTESEKNYSQIECEALALVFAVKRFHCYIYGRSFCLVTDHKPLVTIFGPKTGIPPIAAVRLQMWAITLSAYTYTLSYRAGEQKYEAHCLSRLPVKNDGSKVTDVVSEFYSIRLDTFPVQSSDIARETARDDVLARVTHYVLKGWPRKATDDDLKPYYVRKLELTYFRGCLMWGARVVVPHKLKKEVLQETHEGHPGVVRMKETARSYVWWPSVDCDIEDLVSSCEDCQQQRSVSTVAPVHPWASPTKPWQRIHLDFLGSFQRTNYLVAVDAHSKWPEVFEMKSTTSEATIRNVRELFARFGMPETIVTDNGPQFCSLEFEAFLKMNGVKHVRCAPYHPSSNGLAERFVRTVNEALRKDMHRPADIRLASFLLSYRNTAHATTQQSPAQLLLNRNLRTRLDCLKPSTEDVVRRKLFTQMLGRRSQERFFATGEHVYVRNFRNGPRWLPATVLEKTGPVTYRVHISTDRGPFVWKRHQDHLRRRTLTVSGGVSVSSVPELLTSENDAQECTSSHQPLVSTCQGSSGTDRGACWVTFSHQWGSGSKFTVSEVDFLGHGNDRHGIHYLKDKVVTIQNFPPPSNMCQLQ
ncbi:uncharacterized protein K02A2.6-like [Ornithodoros turicata]|uniref:uncharacterized protein K02A2.6-like n=1 Tax=Ornithodoros turicata TaxID=34597 RepID=UPI0031395F38